MKNEQLASFGRCLFGHCECPHRFRSPFAALAGVLLTAAPALAGLPPAPAGVEVTTSQGIEFVTVGDPGNAAYTGGPAVFGSPYLGRGSVDYSFRMGRTEITTAQWVEFLNVVDTFDRDLAQQFAPTTSFWGAGDTLGAPPGSKWIYVSTDLAPVPELVAVGGISWRAAAQYCNWLHNDKAPTLAALSSGAYDVSTFGQNPDGSFTDQLTRSTGAKYWIPSLDEFLKASYYDPNQGGPGQEGWWDYPYQSDSPPITGLPGTPGAQTSSDFNGIYEWFEIPLGSYPDATTHYGLLDVSGGAAELSEEPLGLDGLFFERLMHKSHTGDGLGNAEYHDLIWRSQGGSFPERARPRTGLRIASVVPSPGAAFVMLGFILTTPESRTRKCK